MEKNKRRAEKSGGTMSFIRKPVQKLTNKELISYLQHLQANAEASVSYDTFVKNTIIKDIEVTGFKWILDEVIDALENS